MPKGKKSKKLYQELRNRTISKKSKKKSSHDKSRKLKNIESIKINENSGNNKYLSVIPKSMVIPKIWELQNRKSFYDWVMNNFNKYEIGNSKIFSKTQREEINKNQDRLIKQLLPIQRLVRDFMQTESPYRGILLYFGLGVGKTLSAIAIAESILNKKQVIVLSKTALEDNFKDNIRKGGRDYMVKNNYWVYCKCSTNNKNDQYAIKFANKLGISKTCILDNEGFYVIDFTKNYSNFNSLSSVHKQRIEHQINTLLNKRFKFLHIDDPYIRKKINNKIFENKVVIIDEVHNLTNSIASNRPSGKAFYDAFMNAKNVKFIFLTGTPLINNVFEASKLFNILRGKIKVYEYKIKVLFNQEINYKKIKQVLKQNQNLNQIVINKINKTIKITKNPDNYLNYHDDKQGGVIYIQKDLHKKESKEKTKSDKNKLNGNDVSENDVSGNDVSGNDVSGNDVSENDVGENDVGGNDLTENDLSGNNLEKEDLDSYKQKSNKLTRSLSDKLQNDIQFIKSISDSLKSLGYKFSMIEKEETCLPDNEDEFQKLFYNPDLNKLKKQDLLKKRIAGLTSYYDFKKPELFPELNKPIKLVMCNMSDYQLGIYEKYRHEEIQNDKVRARRQKRGGENINAAYRTASRMACTFVYPEETGNPYDIPHVELMNEQIKQLKNLGEEIPKVDVENAKKVEAFIKKNLLSTLKRKKKTLLSIEKKNLQKYSPKFHKMIQVLNKEPGCSLVYSQFSKLIGLNIFSLALDATGEWEPFKIKKIGGIYHLISNNPDMKSYKSKSSVKSLSKDKSSKQKDKLDIEKKRYIFYTGEETKEYKANIRLIFNSEFERVDPAFEPVVNKLKELYGSERNLRGKIIKTLMTTQSGTEGLDLKNIRSVHIMEPYWQPVLIEQVIGRAVRTASHLGLTPSERNVSVYIYISTIPKNKITSINQVDVRTDFAKHNDGLGKKGKIITSDEALFIMAERKKSIVNQMLKIIKESAFDCSLNYKDNVIQSPGLVCLDYNTKNRDDYLYTPGIDDTIDIININQEYTVQQNLTKFIYKEKEYYHNSVPTSDGKYYIYDESAKDRVRLPKPVGEILIMNNKKKYGFYVKKKKKKRSKK